MYDLPPFLAEEESKKMHSHNPHASVENDPFGKGNHLVWRITCFFSSDQGFCRSVVVILVRTKSWERQKFKHNESAMNIREARQKSLKRLNSLNSVRAYICIVWFFSKWVPLLGTSPYPQSALLKCSFSHLAGYVTSLECTPRKTNMENKKMAGFWMFPLFQQGIFRFHVRRWSVI